LTPDIALANAWNSGDRSAGEELVARYYESVARFFRTKAGKHADDLVQRTFLCCAEAAGRFRGDSSFRSFLFGIARNVLLEHIRGRARDARIDPDLGVSSIHDLDPGVSTIAFRRAEQRLLIAALQRIPVEAQLGLELYYWEELSITELAQVLGVPEGTVKSRLHRARELLGEAMQSVPASPDEQESVRVLLHEWRRDIRGNIPDVAAPAATRAGPK
jgi:RNA polymerase sigma-70 factor (ECF subfamily)